MHRMTRKARLLAAVVLGAALVPLAAQVGLAQQDIGIQTITVADQQNDQLHARVSGDVAVWQDYRDVGAHAGDDYNADIWARNLTQSGQTKVTDNHTASRPDISGEIIVFADNREGDSDIRGYNLRTGDSFWVERQGGSVQDRPAIDGDVVVWQDNRDGNWDIRMKDLGSGDEDWVSHRDGNQTEPRISGRIVVWLDDRDGCCDIFAKNLDTGDVGRVTDNQDAADPDVGGNWVVYRRGGADRANVWANNIATGERIRLNSTREDPRGQPAVDGRLVVWSDRRNGEDYNILAFDLETQTEYLVARNDEDQLEPAVSNNRVVWTDRSGSRGDRIRGALVTFPAEATPTPGAAPAPSGPCTFILGFGFLHSQLGGIDGSCVDNEHDDPNGTGDRVQTTRKPDGGQGYMVWNNATNTMRWTDGFQTFTYSSCGLQPRLNTQSWMWEHNPQVIVRGEVPPQYCSLA